MLNAMLREQSHSLVGDVQQLLTDLFHGNSITYDIRQIGVDVGLIHQPVVPPALEAAHVDIVGITKMPDAMF
jgi:hypothetical protein